MILLAPDPPPIAHVKATIDWAYDYQIRVNGILFTCHVPVHGKRTCKRK